MSRKVGVIVWILAACLGASAAPITFTFTGTITQVPVDEVYGDVSPGTPISGSFTFDSSTSDGAPGDPSTGSFTQSGAAYVFSVDIGGHLFSNNDFVNVSVFNAGVDQYSVLAQNSDLSLSIFLQDNSASVFSNDSLPLTAPPLASFTFTEFHLSGIINEGQVQYDGTLDTLTGGTAAPEPSTCVLLLTGIYSLHFVRRRRS